MTAFTKTLNNGVEMPGLGAFQSPPAETTAAVEEANPTTSPSQITACRSPKREESARTGVP